MFVCSNEKNYLFLCLRLFVDHWEKKKYKELELAKLKFHIRRNSSLVRSSTIEEKKKGITLEFCIYKELELGKLEYCVAWNSSLPCLSSMWHFFQKKSTLAQVFILFYLFFYES